MAGLAARHDMGGMTMSGGIFTPVDKMYARALWYAIAACVALLTLIRIARVVESRRRLRASRRDPTVVSSRPRGRISQAFATATAMTREMVYPQPVYFTGPVFKYFSPLPVGKWLLLIVYWIVLLSFLWTDTILQPGDKMYAYKWEKVGFRAAWVTVSQVPFVYLLSCKFNPISLLTGISYERFNWLHRWAARTMWLTAIVHWSFFYTEWSIAGIVQMELNMMKMVKYGFGAWGVITWMLLSGFGFFRDLCYELFVLQHIAAAGTLLWLLFLHVPRYASYHIWLAISFVAFDWVVRLILAIVTNTHLLGITRSKTPGYATRLESLPGNVVRLTIEDVDFQWKAGQHAYVYMPGLRPLESHPFTIANAPENKKGPQRLTMLIKAHSGFSKTLHQASTLSPPPPTTTWRHRTFLTGPWGSPPDLAPYETVILIACSTGATFTVPLLEDLIRRPSHCVRTITFHWIVRDPAHTHWFERELRAIADAAPGAHIHLQTTIHVTTTPTAPRPSSSSSSSSSSPPPPPPHDKRPPVDLWTRPRGSSSIDDADDDISLRSLTSLDGEKSPLSQPSRPARLPATLVVSHRGRPTVEAMIRPGVEDAVGETAVVVCGGLAVTAESRTFVAALSDERAVHKGTGAQGVFLYTETYGW
jgi:hypothetical protein